MKIIVCAKQVPNTTEVRIDQKTGTLIREGIASIMNPDDKVALEAALQLKEIYGAHITVLSMGPAQAEKILKEAFAMGADRCILLSDRAFAGSDTLATSSALSSAIKELDYDLIIAGRQAIDGDTAQVGPQIAELLNIPNISYVQNLEVDLENNTIIVERQFENSYQKQRTSFPCLITAIDDLATPRYMTPGGIFNAYNNSQIEIWNLDNITVDKSTLGLAGSPTRVKKSFAKSTKPTGVTLKLEGSEAAEAILKELKKNFIL